MRDKQKQLIREKFETKEWNHWSSFQSKFVRLPDSIKKEIANFWLSELDLAIKQTEERIVEKIEQLPVFQGETNFNDGGDSEYADRRIAVDNSRRRGQNEMKQSIITLIRNK